MATAGADREQAGAGGPGGDLWRTQAELAAIVASSDDGIVSTDLDGLVRSWNQGAERLLGWSAAEMLGRPARLLVPEHRHAELDSLLSRVRGGLPVPTRDTRRLHRDGHEVDVAVSISLIRDGDGRPTGFAALLRDITERKLMEREQRRLLAEATQRERWLAAISEVRLAILGGGDLDHWLTLLVRRALDLSRADGAVVLLPDGGPDRLLVRTTCGELAEPYRGMQLPAGATLVGEVMRSGRAHSLGEGEETGGEGGGLGPGLGPQLAAPLQTSTGTAGVLAVVRRRGGPPFDSEDVRMVDGFAQQAAMALELARARDDREQLTLTAERERIARDLHDHVIQRLFAVGMSLQAVTGAIEEPLVADRIEKAVDDLDVTIREVRSAIFSLEVQARRQAGSARARVLEVVQESTTALGFRPRLQFTGPVDARLPDRVMTDVLAVVREGLSNVARHAGASNAEVILRVDGDELVVGVSDNGRGLGTGGRSSGLSNLRARAETHGGTLDLLDVPGGGLRLRWAVPLSD